ncbi:hypothetical protein B0H14DRAFT_2600171, partial [Mycena olivaceomarginata]
KFILLAVVLPLAGSTLVKTTDLNTSSSLRIGNCRTKLPEALQKEREEQRARDMQRTPFSIAAFEEKLVQVIVSNDLSLQDKDIPHRTKLRSLILDAWLKYYDSLKKELKESLGKISFTGDMWSSKGLQPYLALTHCIQAPDRQRLPSFAAIGRAGLPRRVCRVLPPSVAAGAVNPRRPSLPPLPTTAPSSSLISVIRAAWPAVEKYHRGDLGAHGNI